MQLLHSRHGRSGPLNNGKSKIVAWGKRRFLTHPVTRALYRSAFPTYNPESANLHAARLKRADVGLGADLCANGETRHVVAERLECGYCSSIVPCTGCCMVGADYIVEDMTGEDCIQVRSTGEE